jgi:long-chain acyl-CoA synthetase
MTFKNLHESEPARQATETKPSASPVFRHISCKDGFPSLPVETLYELFSKSVVAFPNNRCLGVRPQNGDGTAGDFVFETYAEVGKKVGDLASAISGLGVPVSARIGVFGANCPEWMMAMQASW